MTPLLSVDRVSKSYWRGRHEVLVLDEVSLEVEPGELVAIFGERASGKTTLLRIACGIERPDRGAVRFEGHDLASAARPPRMAGVSSRIGWVRRTGPAIATEMLDYVALSLLDDVRYDEAHRQAARALADVGAESLATATWGDLSDAERTLVTIAQATVHGPVLLLADDPTVNLGLEEREMVLGLLRQTADRREMGIVMTVPEVPDVLRADAVMSLSDGELICARRHDGQVIDFPLRRDGGA